MFLSCFHAVFLKNHVGMYVRMNACIHIMCIYIYIYRYRHLHVECLQAPELFVLGKQSLDPKGYCTLSKVYMYMYSHSFCFCRGANLRILKQNVVSYFTSIDPHHDISKQPR